MHAVVYLKPLSYICVCVACTELSPELIGLSLVYAISLSGMFQYCIRQSAELENIVGFVSKCTIILPC